MYSLIPAFSPLCVSDVPVPGQYDLTSGTQSSLQIHNMEVWSGIRGSARTSDGDDLNKVNKRGSNILKSI
jgi:hypothetical protein